MTQPAKSRCQPPEVCELVVDQPQPSIGWPSSGPIRAEAVVRHIEAGSELGLKFTAVTESRRAASRYLAYKASEPLLVPWQKVTARSAFSATLGRT